MAKAAKRRKRRPETTPLLTAATGKLRRLVRMREETVLRAEKLMCGRETYADVFDRAVEALERAIP